MKNVLLINSDKPEPLKLLNAREDVHICILASKKYRELYQDAPAVFIDDLTELNQARSATLELTRKNPIDYILTPTERGIMTGGFLRSYLGLPGLSFDQALYFSNKIAMKKKLSAHHLPVAPHFRLDRWEDLSSLGNKLGWPIVIKPALGAGTVHTYRLDSASDGETLRQTGVYELFQRCEIPLLVEKYIHMQAEYHCDSVIRDGKVVFAAVSQYFTPLLGIIGEVNGSYVLDADNPAVLPITQLQQAVIDLFNLSDGVTHLEVFRTDDTYCIGEITCRLGGGGVAKTLHRQFGVDLWHEFIQAGLEEDYTPFSIQRQAGSFGWCGLPGKNGHILAMTSEEELYTIPGVIDITMHHKIGERVSGKRSSVFYNGVLYFHATDINDIQRIYRAVNEIYQVQVE